jgi:hypothetical protein
LLLSKLAARARSGTAEVSRPTLGCECCAPACTLHSCWQQTACTSLCREPTQADSYACDATVLQPTRCWSCFCIPTRAGSMDWVVGTFPEDASDPQLVPGTPPLTLFYAEAGKLRLKFTTAGD